MELERIAVAIHPRSATEAIDLGLRLVQAHARAVFTPWLMMVGPVALLLALALPAHPLIALLLFWLGLPLYDRIVVYVLSHALFGAAPSWRQTLNALPSLLRPHSWNPLERVDFTRSFNLPILQLEHLPPRRRARRIGLLQRQVRGHAVGLSLAFVALEWIFVIGLLSLPSLLLPEEALGRLGLAADTSDSRQLIGGWLLYGAYVTSILFLEPFYLGAGFSLYLNRRTLLEGWDLEIGLRKIARRIAPASWLLALLLYGALPLDESQARDAPQPEEASPRIIAEVLDDPVFGHIETQTRWRYIASENEQTTDGSFAFDLLEWLLNSDKLGSSVAGVLRMLLWLLLIAGIVWLIWRRDRWLHLIQPRRKAGTDDEPLVVAGMDVSPASLPKDIPHAVQTLWKGGHHREAMSLLYRGTLAALVEHRGLQVDASSTEQDCIEAVERLQEPALKRHFRDLTTLWQLLAYGHRQPDTRLVEHLCRQWRKLYGKPKT